MKIAGIIIIAFGLADLIGSYTDFDLWGGFIGVDLPEVLWKYSSYIEIALGYFLMNMGSKDAETDAAVE
jgi:hypothetical protein